MALVEFAFSGWWLAAPSDPIAMSIFWWISIGAMTCLLSVFRWPDRLNLSWAVRSR